jgi:hypothetical protein
MSKKIGLFIKTYSNKQTTNIRIDIVEELFISVKDNVDSNIIKILIVDGCKNDYHKEIIDKYSNIFNEIIYNDCNKGISACQNIGIRHLIYKYDIDIGFGCDDDIIIQKNGINRYVETIIKSNIHHFCYYPYAEFVKMNIINLKYIIPIPTIYKDNILEVNLGVSGCFFSFTKEMIENIGYFPKLSYIYGFEHEIFTYNYLKKNYCYDIISSNSQISNSEKNIELNIKSIMHKSLHNIDNEKIKINALEADIYKKNLGQYISYYDQTNFIQIIIFYEEQNIDDIINDILYSLYLNFMIIIVNENNNNIDKYKNKFYIKIIDSNISDFLINNNNKTYIFNKKIKINNNNIHFINNINEINELKKKRIINNIIESSNSFDIIIDKQTNLLEVQKKIILSNKNIYIKVYKKSFNNEINTFLKCMKKGYCYKNSNIKINNKINIKYI